MTKYSRKRRQRQDKTRALRSAEEITRLVDMFAVGFYQENPDFPKRCYDCAFTAEGVYIECHHAFDGQRNGLSAVTAPRPFYCHKKERLDARMQCVGVSILKWQDKTKYLPRKAKS